MTKANALLKQLCIWYEVFDTKCSTQSHRRLAWSTREREQAAVLK